MWGKRSLQQNHNSGTWTGTYSFRKCSILFYTGLFCLVAASCTTTRKTVVDTKDLSYLYNPTKSSIKPRFSVFNESDASSVLSVRLPASDLLFTEANPRGIPMAQLLITVKLYNITSGRVSGRYGFSRRQYCKRGIEPGICL